MRPAFLFVHGWQGDKSVWDGVIAALGPGADCVAVDLRGSGASPRPGPYNLEQFAADLRETVESLGIAPVVVVGHSMGATVALRFALDSPELTHGLVLIAPVPASGGGYSAKGEAYLRATAGDPAAARSWLARTLRDPGANGTLDRLCAAAARTQREAALESFESWAHADFAEQTREIAVPALVIAPEHDLPQSAEERVAALLPNARFVVLPDAAHYAIVELPHEIADLIRQFR